MCECARAGAWFGFSETGSLYIALVGLELYRSYWLQTHRHLPASASVLGLKVWDTTPGSPDILNYVFSLSPLDEHVHFQCSTYSNDVPLSTLKHNLLGSGTGVSQEFTAETQNTLSIGTDTTLQDDQPCPQLPQLTWQRGISELSAIHRSPGHW